MALDIGETLSCDDRYWALWADWLDVPRHTLSALVGTVVSRGEDTAAALRLLRPGLDVDAEYAAREAAGRGEALDKTDLYDEVRPALAALGDLGVRVVVAGNQTARAGGLLRALRLPVDAVAVSAEWGVAKPDSQFFLRVVDLAVARPDEVLYVGDHPANDIYPAARCGLLTAHIRRGPWGHLWADDPRRAGGGGLEHRQPERTAGDRAELMAQKRVPESDRPSTIRSVAPTGATTPTLSLH